MATQADETKASRTYFTDAGGYFFIICRAIGQKDWPATIYTLACNLAI